MNDELYDNMKGTLKLNIDYTYIGNQFKIEIIDLRHVNIQNGDIIEVYLLKEEDLLADTWDGPQLSNSDINSMNQFIRLTKTTLITNTSLEDDVCSYNSRFTHDRKFIFS